MTEETTKSLVDDVASDVIGAIDSLTEQVSLLADTMKRIEKLIAQALHVKEISL